MPRGRKFTWAQRAAWKVNKQNETYQAAESQPLPSKERRASEQAKIEEFIRTRGVTRVSVRKE